MCRTVIIEDHYFMNSMQGSFPEFNSWSIRDSENQIF